MSETSTDTLSKRALVDAKLTLDEAIEEFTRSQRLGQENILIASEQLHTAVIGLWWRMRPHLRNDDGWKNVNDIESLDLEILYSGTHPQTGQKIKITGFRDLENWVDRSMTVREDVSGPNHSLNTSQREVSVRLPADAALNAAKALSARFHDYGWDVEADKTGEFESDYSDIFVDKKA